MFIMLLFSLTMQFRTDAQSSLGIHSGIHLANPIPEKYSIAKERMDTIIGQAISEADALGIAGSHNTPFILAKIRELTHGNTVAANKFLIEANVVRGTKVAVELAKLDLQDSGLPIR